jgi:hypothetical protein
MLPGGPVWRLRIASQGAYSIGLLFSRTAAGGRGAVGLQRRPLVGAGADDRKVKDDGEFAIEPVPGRR